MASLFSKIASGEIPCHKIAESEKYLAFLDVFPLVKGHTLVIPKKETDYLFDIEDEEFAGLQFVRGEPLRKNIKTVMCHASGFGGHNADLLFARADATLEDIVAERFR